MKNIKKVLLALVVGFAAFGGCSSVGLAGDYYDFDEGFIRSINCSEGRCRIVFNIP
jgi:hypothetical protein